MKKTTLRKLSLKKNIVAQLNKNQMNQLGGIECITFHCTDGCTDNVTRKDCQTRYDRQCPYIVLHTTHCLSDAVCHTVNPCD